MLTMVPKSSDTRGITRGDVGSPVSGGGSDTKGSDTKGDTRGEVGDVGSPVSGGGSDTRGSDTRGDTRGEMGAIGLPGSDSGSDTMPLATPYVVSPLPLVLTSTGGPAATEVARASRMALMRFCTIMP